MFLLSALEVCFVTIPAGGSSYGAMSLLVSNPGTAPSPEPASKTGEFISLTFRPLPGEKIPGLCRRLAAHLRESAATPLQLLVFGQASACLAATEALQKSFGRVDWPVTWVEGAACADGPIAGIQVHAFSGDVERIRFGGRIVGSIFTDGGARQCLVSGLTPADQALSRAGQTRAVLENLQAILASAGFDLADTVRTWFFLEDILSWYDDFNRARTEIYSGVKFRTGSLPASTGVGAKNSAGAALALAAWAFRPLEKNAYAEEVASPLQCPAPAYGSAFSRAMEMTTNAGRRLHISGTASIAPGGKTLWVGDVRKQMELTMDVVEAMLRSRGFTFADLTRATAYFRRPADAGVFAAWLAANQLTEMPVVSAQCDVCRDDLLFELEAEAETGKPNHR
jgi:enamine deaminase RidA (YjgF/YER057c/UK114 family)